MPNHLTTVTKAEAIRNRPPYVITYVSAKSGKIWALKKKKKKKKEKSCVFGHKKGFNKFLKKSYTAVLLVVLLFKLFFFSAISKGNVR